MIILLINSTWKVTNYVLNIRDEQTVDKLLVIYKKKEKKKMMKLTTRAVMKKQKLPLKKMNEWMN